MSNLSVCRMCLSVNVKIQSIQNSPLQDIFEKLASCKLSSEDGRPDTVCYICLSQLQRFYKFRDKSRKSGDILSELSRDGIEISSETVSVLNKEVRLSFLASPVESVWFSSEITQVLVKEEPDSIEDEIKITPKANEAVKVKLEAAVCRVCLSGDLGTRSIKNTLLQVIYEQMTGTMLIAQDGRPEDLCYICLAQLHRWRRLIRTTNKSENILTEILHSGAQLTQSSLLNRRPKSDYSITTLDPITFCAEYEVKLEIVDVKEEFIEIDLPMQDGVEGPPVLGQNQIKVELEQETKPDFKETDRNINNSNLLEACDVCNFKSDSEIKLKKHLRLHDPKRKFPCDLCTHRFISSNHLNNHKESLHRFKHECTHCDQVFTAPSQLKRHSLIHTTKQIYSCEKCNKIFDKEKNLRSHYYNVHPGERYYCDRCDYTATSNQWLQDHVLKVHGDSPSFVCDVCHKTLSLKSSLKRHLLNHVTKKAYECKICFKTFSTSQNCRVHNMLHTGEKPYTCDICKKGFREKQRWKLHALTHNNGKKPFSCNICEKEFYRKDVFKKHMTIHYAQKIYACHLCDLKFSSSTYVKKHMISHSDERPYSCEVCQKRFKASATLKCHMTVHNGEKTFTCDLCKKSFTKKQYLLGHMKYHNMRPFACSICDKRFHTRQILLLHTRTHTGEKPYSCVSCDRTFTQKSSLRRHLRSHSGETPYACDICNKHFAEKLSLFTHKISVHSNINKYICDLCYKVCVDRTKIIHHLKFHNAKKPFTCNICQKAFFKLSTLTHHVKMHVGEYRCAFCDVKFESKTNLDRHNVAVHGAVKQYACNRCELPFDGLIRLNSHMRLHTGEKQFACELCEKTYVEKRDLQHHMKVIHDKLQCFE